MDILKLHKIGIECTSSKKLYKNASYEFFLIKTFKYMIYNYLYNIIYYHTL